MASNETVAEIVQETKSIIDYGDGVLLSLDGRQVFSILCRIEAAHNRELSAEQKRCGEILRDQIAEVERAAEKVAAKDAEITRLRELLKEMTGCAGEFMNFVDDHPHLFGYMRRLIKEVSALEGGVK